MVLDLVVAASCSTTRAWRAGCSSLCTRE